MSSIDSDKNELLKTDELTGQKEKKINQINVSSSELVQIYNSVPTVLAKKVWKVVVTQDSLLTQSAIIFEEARNGNYWIIATEDLTYWLLPKGNYRVNPYEYETLKSLFSCEGSQPSPNSSFSLTQPARVIPVSDDQQWKLEARGVLEFGQTSPMTQLRAELEQANQETQELVSQTEGLTKRLVNTYQEKERFQFQIQGLTQECDDLQSQLEQFRKLNTMLEDQLKQKEQEKKQLQAEIEDSQQAYDQVQSQLSQLAKNFGAARSQIRSQMENINQRLEQLDQEFSQISKVRSPSKNTEKQVNSSSSSDDLLKSLVDKDESVEEIVLTPEEVNLLDFYNSGQDLSQYMIPVSETEESQANRRGGEKQILFAEYKRGSYGIISLDNAGFNLALVPKPKLNINQHNIVSAEVFFECRDFRQGTSKGFKLIKSAKVSRVAHDNQELWKLDERGILQFRT